MKTKNLLSLLAIAGLMIFASCKKDDPSPLTKEEAQTAITTVDGSYNTIKAEYDATTGVLVQETIYNLTLPFDAPKKAPARLESIQKDLTRTIKPAFAKGGSDEFIYFNFPQWVGTWAYNTSTLEWEKISPTPTDQVVIKFSYNGGTNNGTLTYYDYQTKTANGQAYISQLKAKVDIDGQASNPVMSWVYTASKGLTNGSVTFVYNIGAFTQTESYSADIAISNTTSKMNYSLSFEVKKNGAVIYSTSANISMSGTQSTYTATINAQLRVLDIIIKWDIDVDNTTNTENPNNFMKISVWKTNGAKVADVVLVYNAELQDYEPYFKFLDGTTVKASEYLHDLLYEIEDFMGSIMGFVQA
ncbi:MAG: hypothetical protein HOO91_14330 [Bacteroidales bacterium]|nr:hypothetical protein [Bacteroidales bacterium]